MLFFRSEERINQWCEARSTPRRPSVRLDQLWQMALTWYATRLEADSRRPAAPEVREILSRIGLEGEFWDPLSDTFG